MTRKDFELIAEAIRRTPTPADHPKAAEMRQRIISNLAHDLAATNRAFDHTRFVIACGDGR